MRPRYALLAALLLLGACAHDAPPGTPAVVPRSTAPLVGTHWKLSTLGDQVITTPPGAREIYFELDSDNLRLAGFSGCNQMAGGYVLDGDSIKFDQMIGTMMACVSDMDVERRFLAMFAQVARWKIEGQTLTLLDGNGRALAVFVAPAPPAS